MVEHAACPGVGAPHGTERRDLPADAGTVLPKFFEGAKGAVAKIDPKRLLDHRAVKAAPEGGRTGIPHAIRQARDLFGRPAAPWLATNADLGGRPSGDQRRSQVATPAADDARILPVAHRIFGQRIPAQAGRRSPLAFCTQAMRRTRFGRLATRCACTTTVARSASCSKSATRSARVSSWFPGNDPRPKPSTAPSTISAPTG